MKRECKYVMTRAFGPILFGPAIQHNEIATGYEIISAGFCDVFVNNKGDVEVGVYGDSFSLGIKSKPEDEEKIRRMLTGYTKEELEMFR